MAPKVILKIKSLDQMGQPSRVMMDLVLEKSKTRNQSDFMLGLKLNYTFSR